MSIRETYKNQVELLLDILPFIQNEDCFALKGGTAINLFYRDIPRLSVDIDLTYLPIESRETFLVSLTGALKNIAVNLEKEHMIVDIKRIDQTISKLFISNNNATVKIEPNTVIRGVVFEPEVRELCKTAQDVYLQTQKVKTVSFADLYGGKIWLH